MCALHITLHYLFLLALHSLSQHVCIIIFFASATFTDDEADSFNSFPLVPIPTASLEGFWEPSPIAYFGPTPSPGSQVTCVLHPTTPASGHSLFPGSTFEVGGSSSRDAPTIEISSDDEEEELELEDTRSLLEVQVEDLVESSYEHEMRLQQLHAVVEESRNESRVISARYCTADIRTV
ncbi:hypothetical protein L1987_23442 [Smallanthus sonchifolius]|uniref:Uncharacterized protein n=1 Tax=Smallanthus sonchifolius TaxID=185202 RepID=A0ACB9II77_9ASTR|nr:hypothetical protein L1987_23442 [Smallanthus sonchifolius]